MFGKDLAKQLPDNENLQKFAQSLPKLPARANETQEQNTDHVMLRRIRDKHPKAKADRKLMKQLGLKNGEQLLRLRKILGVNMTFQIEDKLKAEGLTNLKGEALLEAASAKFPAHDADRIMQAMTDAGFGSEETAASVQEIAESELLKDLLKGIDSPAEDDT